jgi:hypothetical protein
MAFLPTGLAEALRRVGSIVVQRQEPKGECDEDGVAGQWNGAAQLGSVLTLPRSCRREMTPSLRKTFFKWYSTV